MGFAQFSNLIIAISTSDEWMEMGGLSVKWVFFTSEKLIEEGFWWEKFQVPQMIQIHRHP